MFADLFFIAVLIGGGIAGTYTDFKRREVPDWITFFLITVGVGGHLILSLLGASFQPLLYSVVGALAFFAIANVMFYSGSWGGGDAKFLVGAGALLPLYPESLQFLNPYLAQWPFLVTLFFNILLFGAFFGILYTLYKTVRNWSGVKEKMSSILKRKPMKIVRISLPISFILVVLFFLFLPSFFEVVFVIWMLAIFLFYLIVLSLAVEKVALFKRIKPSRLREGDWVAEDIRVDGETVYEEQKIGIEMEDIKKLQKLGEKGKLVKVKIKEGLPLLPAFVTGILVSLFFGDILFQVFSLIF